VIHLKVNGLAAERIRVLQFLREDEVNRDELQPHLIEKLLSRSLANPANIALQNHAREFQESMK
jgi:hypothetical protein